MDAARPILLAAAVVSLVMVVTNVTLAVPAGRMADQYRQAAFWRARMDTADPPRSLEAVRRDLTVEASTRQDQRRARADRNRFLYHGHRGQSDQHVRVAPSSASGLRGSADGECSSGQPAATSYGCSSCAGVVGTFEWARFPQARPDRPLRLDPDDRVVRRGNARAAHRAT